MYWLRSLAQRFACRSRTILANWLIETEQDSKGRIQSINFQAMPERCVMKNGKSDARSLGCKVRLLIFVPVKKRPENKRHVRAFQLRRTEERV